MTKKLLFLIFHFVIFYSWVFAQKTWDGGAGTSNWGDANNWNPNGVPGAGDNVTFDNNAGTVTVIVNGTYSCNNLVINSNDDVTVQTTLSTYSLTINGTLTLDASTNKNNILDAAAGAITVVGAVTFGPATGSERDAVIVSTGSITFSSAVTLPNSSLVDITFTSNGTINFNGGFTDDGAGVFVTVANCIVNFGGNYTNNSNAMTWDLASNAVFTGGTPTISAGAAITFGNFKINSGITVTPGSDFTVAGNWTNNGGTFSGAGKTVTFSGTAKTIGGTGATTFGNIIIADNATYTLQDGQTNTCGTLTFAAGGNNSSLTHTASTVLNPSTDVIINQPTAASKEKAWNINSGSANIAGKLRFIGTSDVVTQVAKVSVAGTLTITDIIEWMANTAVATEVIQVTTGTINFTKTVTMNTGSGTIQATGTGTMNLNEPTALNFGTGGGTAPVFSTISGSTVNFAGNVTASDNALTFTAGSNQVFTATATVTPTAAITFGNLQINSGITLNLSGNISVTGNWTNLGATFNPSSFGVTFNGTGTQTITKAGGETFYTLTASTTGPLTLANNVMVTNTLNMSGGNFNLNSMTLTLGNSADATLTRTAGIMYGGIFKRWWPAGSPVSSTGAPLRGLFPMGTSTDYSPIAFNSTADPTTGGYVSASHSFALTVTDVTYTDNESDAIERIHDTKQIITTSALTGGTYNIDVTYTILSATGVLTDMKLETYTGGVMGSVGTSAATTGTVPAPTVKRTGLTAAQLANDWVLATKNKTATPLRAVYYSRISGNWNDVVSVWATSDGGPACSCSPATDGYAIITAGTTVSITAPATVDFIDIRNTGILNGTSNLTVNYDLTTIGGTGAFNPTSGSWLVTRNVKLNGTSSSNTPGGSAMTITGDLFLTGSTTLTLSANLTVSGKLTVDGLLALGGFNLALNGSGTVISSASGNITTSGGTPSINLTNNKSISSGTVLTIGSVSFPVTLALAAATTATNSGSITLNGDLTGANAATSIWTNDAGSTLNITGVLLGTGVLNASASPNTINYTSTGAQSIKAPASSYYNLICSNGGTKSLSSDISVTNLVTIQGAAILDESADANDLTGGGGLTMTGTSQLIVRNGNIATTLPELSGVYTLSAGTVTITAATSGGTTVTVRGATYYNLILNGGINHNCVSLTSVSNNFTVSGTTDITSNGVLTVGGTLTYSSTDADGWTLNNNVTAGLVTLSGGTITDGGYTITINGTGWTKNGGTFSATGTTTFTNSSSQTIGGTSSTSFNNLTVNNSSSIGITLAQPITVAGILTLTDGYVNTDATNLLTMASGSSVSPSGGSSGSFITGPVAKTGSTDFVFPTGADVAPAGAGAEDVWARIAVTSLSASETFTARYFFAQSPDFGQPRTAPLIDISSGEYWTLNRSGTASAKVTLYFQNAGLSGINDCPDLTVARFNGTNWVEEVATTSGTCSGAGSGSTVTNAAVTAFSPFVFGSKSAAVNPLPVELLTFDAALIKNVVELTWSTATETNNDYFTVEKTRDGKEFEEVVVVKGAGNSNIFREYSATDAKPYKGISYYRLKQTDVDGSYTYSEMVAINNPEGREVEFIVFPNPSDGKNVTVGFSGNGANEEVLVVLNDIDGREVFSKVLLTDDNGSFIMAVDVENRLPAGIYIVTGSSRNDIYSRKLIIR